jgi:hypothetical protein
MKSDQILLQEAYEQINRYNHIHQLFLTEAGLLDKAKQIGSAVLDKAKSMFGNSIVGFLQIIQKTNPQLFTKIQTAVQQKDEQTLQSIFKNANTQQQVAQESFVSEGVVDTVKGMYSKAYNLIASKPEMAAKIAIAGIAAAMAATGPDGLNQMAGFLLQAGGKVLGGAAVGGAVGAVTGAVRGGVQAAKQGTSVMQGVAQGAKKDMKRGAGIGAAVGLGSAVGDTMTSSESLSDIDDAFKGLMKSAEPNEVRQLKYIQNTLSNVNLTPKELGDYISILNGQGEPKDKIELINFLMQR